jgi:hypothetical protein
MRKRLAESARAFSATARNRSLLRAELAFGASWTAEWAFMVAQGVVAFRAGGDRRRGRGLRAHGPVVPPRAARDDSERPLPARPRARLIVPDPCRSDCRRRAAAGGRRVEGRRLRLGDGRHGRLHGLPARSLGPAAPALRHAAPADERQRRSRPRRFGEHPARPAGGRAAARHRQPGRGVRGRCPAVRRVRRAAARAALRGPAATPAVTAASALWPATTNSTRGYDFWSVSADGAAVTSRRTWGCLAAVPGRGRIVAREHC